MKNSAKIYVCRDYIELGKPLHKKFLLMERAPFIYDLFDKSSKLCGSITIDSYSKCITGFIPNHGLFKSLPCKHIITGVIDLDKLIKLSNEIIGSNYEVKNITSVANITQVELDSMTDLGFYIYFDYTTKHNGETFVTVLNEVHIGR